MIHPSPFRTISPWINTRNRNQFFVKKNNNNNNTSIILNHRVPNNFLFISVVAALVYVRSHVNVPFHLLQFKIAMLHQYLLDKIIRVHHQSIPPILVVKKCELIIDFLLSTDHLRRYLFEQSSIEIQNRQIFLPKLTLSVLLLPFLFPLTFCHASSSNKQSRSFLIH